MGKLVNTIDEPQSRIICHSESMSGHSSHSTQSSCYNRAERGQLLTKADSYLGDVESSNSYSDSPRSSELSECGSEDTDRLLTIASSSSSSIKQQQQMQIIMQSPLRRGLKLLFGVCGIYAAYLSYGLYQEDLFAYTNAQTGLNFTHVWFLQVLESSASILLGLVGRQICGGRSDVKLRPFLLSGASQVFAKVFMSLSLVAGTVSYPVVTLAKSGKIVPVMIGQICLGGSNYGALDYAFAALIVAGTVLLSLGTHSSKHQGDGEEDDDATAFLGYVFVGLSLVMDGCTGGLQKQLKRDMAATPPTTYDFVLYSHLSMVTVALAVSVVTGDLWHGAQTILADAQVAKMVGIICLLSVLGQSFIFFVISNFDPLVCATVTTTRKMWSVMLSVAFKGHHLNGTGKTGLTLAAAGLAIEMCNKCRQQQRNSSNGEPYTLLTKNSLDKESDDDEDVSEHGTSP